MWDFCDMHAHILPGMDDGCKTPEESVQVLALCYQQGIRYMFATPHYYPVESVESFLSRRQAAWEWLEEYLIKEKITDIPQICLGAEVAYRAGLSREEDLAKLCLGKSDYLLLELPLRAWSSEDVRQVKSISLTQGITPVLAHYERYKSLQTAQRYEEMANLDALIQMNAERLTAFSTRGSACRKIRAGRVHLLGSDCHNMEQRKPNLAQAIAYLKHRGLQNELNEIANLSIKIFRLAQGKGD